MALFFSEVDGDIVIVLVQIAGGGEMQKKNHYYAEIFGNAKLLQGRFPGVYCTVYPEAVHVGHGVEDVDETDRPGR